MQHNFINSSNATINLGYQVITGEEKRIQFIQQGNPFLLFNNTIFLYGEKLNQGEYFNTYRTIKDYTDRYEDIDQKVGMAELCRRAAKLEGYLPING